MLRGCHDGLHGQEGQCLNQSLLFCRLFDYKRQKRFKSRWLLFGVHFYVSQTILLVELWNIFHLMARTRYIRRKSLRFLHGRHANLLWQMCHSSGFMCSNPSLDIGCVSSLWSQKQAELTAREGGKNNRPDFRPKLGYQALQPFPKVLPPGQLVALPTRFGQWPPIL